MMIRLLCSVALWLYFVHSPDFGCKAHFIENNSTNFHNMKFNSRYNFNRYHSYLFDYWKSIDFEAFMTNFHEDLGYNKSWSEDAILANLKHDDESDNLIPRIASLCGRLRNASSPFMSDACLKDLDYVACALFDFVRDAKKLLKNDCKRLEHAHSVDQCNEKLKNKLLTNLWPIQMLDSFGKMPAGLNMGNHMTLGRYSDCNAIEVPRETHNGRPFRGNYCRVTFRIPLPETTAQITKQCGGVENLINGDNMTCTPTEHFARMKWGICAPASCNTRNMTILFRFLISPTKHLCNTTVVCVSEPEYSKDIKFIIAMVILSQVALLVFAGTFYDMAILRPNLKTLFVSKFDTINEQNGENVDQEKLGCDADIVLNNGRTRREYWEEQPTFLKILQAFSAYSNGEKIFNTDGNVKEIRTIQAISALSGIWLIWIYSHVYIMSYIDNTRSIPKMIAKLSFQWINNGSFVSDTFLLISGFLAALHYFKASNGNPSKSFIILWIKNLFHGFLRIYFPFLFAMIIMLFVWKYLINGPLWTIYFFNPCSPLKCIQSFWTNLLFLNNFMYMNTPCYPIFQLLALTVQIKMLCHPLLAAFAKSPKIGFSISGVMMVISCLLQVLFVFAYNLPPSLMANVDAFSMDKPLENYYNIIFIKPYTRWNAFIIGIILAVILSKKDTNISEIATKFCKIFWILAIVVCGLVIFGMHGYATEKSVSPIAMGFYAAFSRLAWCLAIAVVIYMCETGKGGVVQWWFFQSFWAPLARLTYSTYIVGPYVVLYTYVTSESVMHVTPYNMMYFSIGCSMITYITAFLFHLFFEGPILSLRQIFGTSNDNFGNHLLPKTENGDQKMRNHHPFGGSSSKMMDNVATNSGILLNTTKQVNLDENEVRPS